MAGPTVKLSVVPTGGVIRLEMPGWLPPASGLGTAVISRAVSGASGLSSFTTLYSGTPGYGAEWVDAGDELTSPLLSGSGYVYQVSDGTGTTQVGPAYPVPTFVTYTDQLTQLFIRLLQAGVNNLVLPPYVSPPVGGPGSGYGTIQVLSQMPQGGFQALPYIIVNLDLIQQREVMIGQDVQVPDQAGHWHVNVNAKRVWRVTVMSRNPTERDFYRDSLIAIYQLLLATVFMPIGLEVHHEFQAASGTDAREWDGMAPGFYYSELLFEIDGEFPVAVVQPPQYIEALTVAPTYGDGVSDTFEAPPTD